MHQGFRLTPVRSIFIKRRRRDLLGWDVKMPLLIRELDVQGGFGSGIRTAPWVRIADRDPRRPPTQGQAYPPGADSQPECSSRPPANRGPTVELSNIARGRHRSSGGAYRPGASRRRSAPSNFQEAARVIAFLLCSMRARVRGRPIKYPCISSQPSCSRSDI